MNASAFRKPQFEFTTEELIPIAAANIASGGWGPKTELECKKFMRTFVHHHLPERGFDKIRQFFWSVQYKLMAIGRSSFTDVQMFPAFNQSALKNMVELDAAWQSGGGDAFEAVWRRIFAPGWQAGVLPNQIIRLSGGSGDCEKNAICIHAPDAVATIIAEYWYLHYVYGRRDVDWKYSSRDITRYEGREFDVIRVELHGGEIEPTFFVRNPKYHYM